MSFYKQFVELEAHRRVLANHEPLTLRQEPVRAKFLNSFPARTSPKTDAQSPDRAPDVLLDAVNWVLEKARIS